MLNSVPVRKIDAILVFSYFLPIKSPICIEITFVQQLVGLLHLIKSVINQTKRWLKIYNIVAIRTIVTQALHTGAVYFKLSVEYETVSPGSRCQF